MSGFPSWATGALTHLIVSGALTTHQDVTRMVRPDPQNIPESGVSNLMQWVSLAKMRKEGRGPLGLTTQCCD